MTAAEKYRKVLEINKKKTYKAEDECGFGRNTLANAIKENREMSEDYHKKFMTVYSVNPDWWETGKGDVIAKNGTYVELPNNNPANDMTTKETFYRDLIEGNDEYSILPRAVLKDYKIVPDKIIDVIIASNENEKKALERSMTLEIEGLNKKYELLIEGYENKIKRLEGEKVTLEKEKEDLRRQIPAKNQ